jgi:hypothetical protein
MPDERHHSLTAGRVPGGPRLKRGEATPVEARPQPPGRTALAPMPEAWHFEPVLRATRVSGRTTMVREVPGALRRDEPAAVFVSRARRPGTPLLESRIVHPA